MFDSCAAQSIAVGFNDRTTGGVTSLYIDNSKLFKIYSHVFWIDFENDDSNLKFYP